MQGNEKRTVKVVAYTYVRKRSKILVYIIYIYYIYVRCFFIFKIVDCNNDYRFECLIENYVCITKKVLRWHVYSYKKKVCIKYKGLPELISINNYYRQLD